MDNFRTTLLVILTLTLASCKGVLPPPTDPVEVVPTVTGDKAVIVEGKLVPNEFVNLSFNMGGTVLELPIKEGQEVQAGQVLARLDQADRLAAAVSTAEMEVITARQALDMLEENADVVTAAALQAVAKARDDVRDAERYRNNLQTGGKQTDIDSARANVILLKDALDQANKDYASYENKPEDNIARATYLSRMAQAQRRYDDAVRLLDNLEGSASEIDLTLAEASVLLAQARLALAELDYEDVKNGPNPEDLEIAKARLSAAESGLAAAESIWEDCELRAPITGTIVQLDLKQGEQVIIGQPVIVLADFSQWRVETDDLNEMEIPRVQVGQAATLTPDAFPDLSLSGKVDSISQIYIEKYGDVTYTANILVLDSDPRLRWGMTIAVRFEP